GPSKRTRSSSSPISLLVVPASLVGNWKEELQRFGPSLRVFYAHASECDDAELARVASDPQHSLDGIDLVMTTYSLARRSDWLRAMSWRLVVVDEAQAI